MFAAHRKLDNMIVAVDFNQKQIYGSTGDVMILLLMFMMLRMEVFVETRTTLLLLMILL